MNLKFSVAILVSLISVVSIAQKAPGYTLLYATSGTGATAARLVDTSGTVFKSWTGLPSSTVYSAYMFPGGYLLRPTRATGVSFTGGPIGGKVTKTDWSGALVWEYTYSTTNYCAHHDICPMPNGNVLIIAYERRTAAETSAMGGNSAIEMWPDKIVEVKQTGTYSGTVVWEWKAWDHMQQNVSPTKPNYFATLVPEKLNINYKQTKDWMHVNGVDYNPELDQITISSHNLNEIYVIDHSTTSAEAATSTGGRSGKGGDILYRFGNPAAYGGTGTATINVCHDAHWIKEGPYKNWLSYFCNRGVSTSQSSVDYVIPPLVTDGFTYDKTGTQYGPSTYSKRYPCNGYTSNEGGSQTFSNGNMLYTIALAGNVFEVDSTGKQVGNWSAGGVIAKAKRYTPCELNGGLVATCSPANLDVCGVPSSPIALNCSVAGTGTITYSWTSYPSGFTSTAQNPSVSPTTSTTYKCVASNGSCTAVSYVVINIRAKVTVNAGNDTIIGASQPVTLTANATNAVSYKWSTGATTASINVAPAVTTLYKVVVTSIGGCSDSDEVTVNVQGGLLTASASAASNALCAGDSTKLSAFGSGGSGTYTYSWSSVPIGFTSTLKNPFTKPIVTTQYNLIVNDGSGNANANCTVTVNAIPATPVVTRIGNSFTSSVAFAYQWYKDGVLIPAAVAQVYIATNVGDYTVKIFDANGCMSAASAINTYTGINKGKKAHNITIYPNPASSELQIDFEGAVIVSICDISGKVVVISTTKKIDTTLLAAGLYTLNVVSDGELIAVKKISLIK